MNIQIWNGKEWVTKFSAPASEVEEIKKALEEGGLRVIVVGDGDLPGKGNNLERTIVKALLSD